MAKDRTEGLRTIDQWICPKCGRSFRNKDQSHYCGEKPSDIDEYIQSSHHIAELSCVRDAIRKAIPEAEERISWSMPTFWKGCNIIHFAEQKNHVGIYPGPEAVAHFQSRLSGFKCSKGSIRIPYDRIDAGLIGDIASWCYENAASGR